LLLETLRGRFEQIWLCDVILKVSELCTSPIRELRVRYQIGKNQLALVALVRVNMILVTGPYLEATEVEMRLPYVKFASTTTFGRISTSHATLQYKFRPVFVLQLVKKIRHMNTCDSLFVKSHVFVLEPPVLN
jgi:hypothetical protein